MQGDDAELALRQGKAPMLSGTSMMAGYELPQLFHLKPLFAVIGCPQDAIKHLARVTSVAPRWSIMSNLSISDENAGLRSSESTEKVSHVQKSTSLLSGSNLQMTECARPS